jgi:hypothetical protein
MKIVIIGAGWYGLYIALKKVADEVVIIERDAEIFTGASRHNQCRLHQGFHYPRSFETRRLCRMGFDRFMEEFPQLTYTIERNWYMVSEDSLLDLETYLAIFSHEGYDYKLVPAWQNRIAIEVTERGIDPAATASFFAANLPHVVWRFNHNVDTIDAEAGQVRGQKQGLGEAEAEAFCESFDFCYDCTNLQVPWNSLVGLPQQLNIIDVVYEQTTTLLYKKTGETPFGALTIMDGPFLSIFPYDLQNSIYSLTHVVYSPYQPHLSDNLETLRARMETDACKYYPGFLSHFEYVGYFKSPKTKPVSRSDSRKLLQLRVAPNVERISCGKITGIFQLNLD